PRPDLRQTRSRSFPEESPRSDPAVGVTRTRTAEAPRDAGPVPDTTGEPPPRSTIGAHGNPHPTRPSDSHRNGPGSHHRTPGSHPSAPAPTPSKHGDVSTDTCLIHGLPHSLLAS